MSEQDARKAEEEETLPAVAKEEVTEAEKKGIESEDSEELPIPLPKSVRQFIQSFSMTMGPGFPALGLMDKLKDEHITQFFDHVEAESRRDDADRKSQRSYWFWTYVFSVLAVFGFIAFLVFFEKSDLLVPVLTSLISLIGGFGAGWGIGEKGQTLIVQACKSRSQCPQHCVIY